jgi:hypothetical protein
MGLAEDVPAGDETGVLYEILSNQGVESALEISTIPFAVTTASKLIRGV